MKKRIPLLVACSIISGCVGAVAGYEYAKMELRDRLANAFGGDYVYDAPTGSQYIEPATPSANEPSFNCLDLGEPQIVDGRLIFGITNDCGFEISYASWDVNIYRSGESNIFDTAILMVSDIPASGYKQDKVLADLPEGEFSWEALPASIR